MNEDTAVKMRAHKRLFRIRYVISAPEIKPMQVKNSELNISDCALKASSIAPAASP